MIEYDPYDMSYRMVKWILVVLVVLAIGANL